MTLALSYNGWTASKASADFGGLDNRVVPGTDGVRLRPGVRAGDVATVLFYVAAQLDARVEAGELYDDGDDWGWAFRPNRNANNLSCHASATAFDWNAVRHPNGRSGTFTKDQVKTIRAIQAEVEGTVRWGGDFTGTPDEMHFEIVATPARVAAVADRLTRRGAAGSPTTTLPVQEDEMSAAELQKIEGHLGHILTTLEGHLGSIREEIISRAGQTTADVLYKQYDQADGGTRNVPDMLRQLVANTLHDGAPAVLSSSDVAAVAELLRPALVAAIRTEIEDIPGETVDRIVERLTGTPV